MNPKENSGFNPSEININQEMQSRRVGNEVSPKGEDKFYKIFNSSPYPIMLIDISTGYFSDINGAFAKNIGYEKKDLIGKSAIGLGVITSDVEDMARKLIMEKGEFSDLEVKIKTKSGGERIGLISGQIIDINDQPYVMQTIIDITKQKEVENELRKSQERLRAILSGISEVIGIVDKNGNLFYNSENIETFFGWGSETFIGNNIWSKIHPDDLERVMNEFKMVYDDSGSKRIIELRFKHKNGEYKTIEVKASNYMDDKSIDGILIDCRDITENRQKEKEIIYLNQHDSLTGLYNRGFFETELKKLDEDTHLPLSIVVFDVDGLKLVNDAFGHFEGDNLLKGMSEILKKTFRANDIVARWGGDEFMAILPNISNDEMLKIINRIKEKCSLTTNQKIPLHVSIGGATKTINEQNVLEVIKTAEATMYNHKLLQKDTISNSIMLALEQTLREKDLETEEHTSRVRGYAIALGKEMGLKIDELEYVSLLASLHDIGKVAIPETILKKGGPLTDEEWEIIKRHPEIGHNIAKSSRQLSHIANDILYCHEKFDGTGYPQNLDFKKTSLVSRIIFLTDSYDVMTSERPYKKAMTKEEAIFELKKCSWTQFDPLLVKSFIRVLEKEIK